LANTTYKSKGEVYKEHRADDYIALWILLNRDVIRILIDDFEKFKIVNILDERNFKKRYYKESGHNLQRSLF